MTATPTPTMSRDAPVEKAPTIRLNEMISIQNPSTIEKVAYQDAGLSGDRTKVPSAPWLRPLTRAPRRALRTRSEPRTTNGAPITVRTNRDGRSRPAVLAGSFRHGSYER